jgi:putative Mg2+ transporter-C (MgtC) family protein
MDFSFFDVQLLTPYFQLTLALVLGMILGLERSLVGKHAGMRTFALVSIGACLFVLISQYAGETYPPNLNIDPLRIAASVVAGIGFLGAGMIIFDKQLKGLTTAASLWVTAGIGMAVGFKIYDLAIFTAVATLFIFEVLWHVEQYAARHVPFGKDVTINPDADEHINT